MALCRQEGTADDVLAYFSLPGGAVPKYVRIDRIDIDYNELRYTTQLRVYVSREAREENPYCGATREIGETMSQEDIDAMRGQDVRDVIYPKVAQFVVARQTTKQSS